MIMTMVIACLHPLAAVDWKQVEREYLITRDRLLQQGKPAYYLSIAGPSLLVSDPRPEFGLGAHEISPAVLDNLCKANIRFVRITLYWGLVENTAEPGVYNETELRRWDAMVTLFARYRMVPLVVVHGNPPGASYATRHASYQRFAQFMRVVVARYPYVRYWELFNEMDGAFTDLFGAGVTPEVPMRMRGAYYTEMLKVVYPVIKATNPHAIVVTGGMSDWSEFPTGIYLAGGRPYFDIMNLHTYGIPVQWSFVMRGTEIRRIMIAHGDALKPLWNTEFGVDAAALVRAWGLPKGDAGSYFDRTQAEMILDCLDFNRKAGLYQKCFAYQYAAANESVPDGMAQLQYPAGMTLDDYGYGFTRRDGITMRPVLQEIIERQINNPSNLYKPVKRHLRVAGKRYTVATTTEHATIVTPKK